MSYDYGKEELRKQTNRENGGVTPFMFWVYLMWFIGHGVWVWVYVL